MDKQKGLAPILIVLLIAVGIGGYLLYQKQPKQIFQPQNPAISQSSPTPSLSVTSVKKDDETANWKTYTNSNAGLSFKYPLDCESPRDGVSVISLRCYADKNIDRSAGTVITNNDLVVTINYEKNNDNESLEGYFNRMKKSYPKMVNVRDLIINGEPAKAWVSEGQLVNNEFYHVISKGKSIDVVKHPVSTSKQPIFDQILSTFRFD